MRWFVLVALLAIGCGSEESGAKGTGGASSGGSSGSAGTTGVGASSGACTEPTVVTTLTNASFPAPTGYQGGTEPQLDLDVPDAGFTWNDPHVLEVGSEYWMYASATNNFDFPVVIYRLVSTDGIDWKRNPTDPVLTPGAAGSFDAGGVETPAVVFFAGEYHLFYTAYSIEVDRPGHAVTDYRVGHATSCDGVNWTRDAKNPVVAPSGENSDPSDDWMAFIVGEPGPVVHDGELHLYFTTVGANVTLATSLEVIGVTTSTDGKTWSTPKSALEPDQAQYPRIVDPGPPVGGWVGYSTPNAISLNGQVHLYVDVAYDPDGANWKQVRLHHAVSDDGLTAFVQDPSAIAKAGDFPWAVDEIRSPHALIDGTTLRLYFAGHELDGIQPDHFAIGMMTSDLAK